MTVLLIDARAQMSVLGYGIDGDAIFEILYADDTLLMHSSEQFLESYMKCIEKKK